MNDESTRARLERVFQTLTKQKITPVLILTGSTGVIEDSAELYVRLARAVGTPNSWVGAHVGAQEFGGGYWDKEGELRYRYADQLVRQVYFWYPPRPELAQTFTAALTVEGLKYEWSGSTIDSVILDLTGVSA